MKIIVILLISSFSWAWTIEQKYSSADDGSFVSKMVVTCAATQDGFCVKLCGNTSACEQEAPLCVNCAGSANSFMKMMFVSLTDFYFPARQAQDEELAHFLRSERYTVINLLSAFNFYTAPQSEQLKKQFLSFCPAGAKNPNFFLRLDSQYEPIDVEFVSCQLTEGETVIYKTEKKKLESLKLTYELE